MRLRNSTYNTSKPPQVCLLSLHSLIDPSLNDSDRDALRKGASTVGTHATIGSVSGKLQQPTCIFRFLH